MFDYACILVAFLIARKSRPEYRAIAYLLLVEFVAHKTAYILGVELTDLLNPTGIYLTYIIIETLIIVAMVAIQAHTLIIALIFVNLGYNMLTISQYSMSTYDFYSLYKYFVGSLMILELVYLIGIHRYVANYRRKHGFINVNYIDRMFFIYRRPDNWLYLQGPKR